MRMKTPTWTMLLVIGITVIIPIAQVLLKQGATLLHFNVLAILINWKLLLGVLLYALSSLLLLFALRYGELSVLYPLLGLNYVWVNLVSWLYLGELFTTGKAIGVGVIFLGVVILGRSGVGH